MIPMVDLQGQYQALKTEIDAAVMASMASARYVSGPNVTAFEEEVATHLGVRHAIACASGTDALQLALRAAGIGAGDEVITSPFTFIATAEAICHTGARPVFCDILPDTFNLDPAALERAITPRTRAVIPIHLFGQPADMPSIQAVCQHHPVTIIEDCAQSFGAAVHQKMTGALGLLGCFSFFPSKNLGCFGDGGLITSDDASAAEQCRILRNHGSRERYYHDIVGFNSRLDDMQAAILRVKLRYMGHFNAQRQRVAERYSAKIHAAGITTPYADGIGQHVYHQYTLLSDRREAIRRALHRAGIASAIYYPVPLHQQRAFAGSARARCRQAENAAARCLSLPIYPELSDAQIDTIAAVVNAA